MAKLTATEWIWRDGEFIPWSDATVHLLSHSMQFGSAVFEGMRAYATPKGPAIFRLEDHLQRMLNSCKVYRMELKYSIDDLVAACCELVEKNRMDACYIRPMALRGYGAAGMVPFESPIETYLPCYPWGTYLGEGALENGVDACVTSWQRMAPNTVPSLAKIAGNYLSGQLIKMEALQNGYAEGIALTTDGMISEGSGQNVFLVMGGTLYTPPLSDGILAGITRRSIMQLAKDAGIPILEQELPREVLYAADEIFMSGTAAEVTPIRSVDKLKVGDGKPGKITRLLQKQFLDTVKGAIADTHGWLTYVRAERASARGTAKEAAR